ncbi:MAG: DNA-3-methyladenine glycosylase I [Candidatus Pacebacteria bacterium]|nr:DNA-3-methyladenine glycosylase I [Candidatus Paceibacterota bacterium]
MHPYCLYVATIKDKNDVDKIYHDLHYGVPIHDDNELFCRLVMEINQAGLSWHTILVKEKNFRKAYHNFDIKKVAKYGEKDVTRLMSDAGIIRNRLKINAAIYNAQRLTEIQKEVGGFKKWLDTEDKRLKDLKTKDDGTLKEEWVKLFKKNFKFVGGEIVGEFLMSINMLPGSHDKSCYAKK